MKLFFFRASLLLTVISIFTACSPIGTVSATPQLTEQKTTPFIYSASELETLKLINDYRVSIGLNTLEAISYLSLKSEEHDVYMIDNNVVNHNDFVSRSEDIMKVLGANTVSENIAYNYSTPTMALNAWLNSPAHKENIEGDYTNFGIAIRENPVDGSKYYTNIFVKI